MYNKDVLGAEGIPNIYVDNISVKDSHEISENVGVSLTIDLFFYNALKTLNKPVFQYANQNSEPYTVRFINFYSQQILTTFLGLQTESQQQAYIREQQPLGNLMF